jgi:hypothetical protein
MENKLTALIRAISESRDFTDEEKDSYIDDIVGEDGLIASMCDYSNTVITGSFRLMAMRLRYQGDTERIQYFTEQMDRTRRRYHEAICEKLNLVNRYSERFLGELFYDKPIILENGHYTRESRREAAAFAADFLDTEFRKGIGIYSKDLESGVPDHEAMEKNTITRCEEAEYVGALEGGTEEIER